MDTGNGTDPKYLVRDYLYRLIQEKDLAEDRARDPDATAGATPGPRSVKEFIAAQRADYPNLHVEIEDIFAQGGRVAARLAWWGSHRQTGELFHQIGIVLLRVDEEGRIADRWSPYQAL